MCEQPSLDFDHRPAYRKDDPETSKEAFRSLDASQRRYEVARKLYAFGPNGACASQLAEAMGLPRDSVSPRLPELRREEVVVKTDDVRSWRGSRRRQHVWVHVHWRSQG